MLKTLRNPQQIEVMEFELIETRACYDYHIHCLQQLDTQPLVTCH